MDREDLAVVVESVDPVDLVRFTRVRSLSGFCSNWSTRASRLFTIKVQGERSGQLSSIHGRLRNCDRNE